MVDFKFTIHDDVDHIFEEKGNTISSLRKLSWGESGNPKYEIRKWYVGKNGSDERPSKGFTFIDDEGPTNLTHTLLETGFGDTKQVLETIKTRDDFNSALCTSFSKEELENAGIEYIEPDEDENLYDPKAIFE